MGQDIDGGRDRGARLARHGAAERQPLAPHSDVPPLPGRPSIHPQIEKLQPQKLRMATSIEVMRLRSDHPLRDLLGVPWMEDL